MRELKFGRILVAPWSENLQVKDAKFTCLFFFLAIAAGPSRDGG